MESIGRRTDRRWVWLEPPEQQERALPQQVQQVHRQRVPQPRVLVHQTGPQQQERWREPQQLERQGRVQLPERPARLRERQQLRERQRLRELLREELRE